MDEASSIIENNVILLYFRVFEKLLSKHNKKYPRFCRSPIEQ